LYRQFQPGGNRRRAPGLGLHPGAVLPGCRCGCPWRNRAGTRGLRTSGLAGAHHSSGRAAGLGQGAQLRRLLRRQFSGRSGPARGWRLLFRMSQHREMQIFLAVAQAGSLAAAARVLQLSQATVMRSVAALESRLDSTLLLRGPRGVSLSPAGAAFSDSCQRILQLLDEAEQSVNWLDANPAGQLTLALPLLMAHQV